MGKEETIDMFGADNALAVAKRETMEKARDKGCSCPVCGQFVKVYKRPITSTMARQLIRAYHSYGAGPWFHAKNVIMGGSSTGDFAKFEYWGMIQRQNQQPGTDNKKTSGLWRITPSGEQFVLRQITAPKYAVIYNAQLLELAGDEVTIADALGTSFNYNELMQAVGLASQAG